MRRTAHLCALLLIVIACVVARCGEPQVALRITGTKDEQVGAFPVVMPGLRFQLVRGPKPEPGTQLCKVKGDSRDFGDHRDTVIAFHCGDTVLELRGVDF